MPTALAKQIHELADRYGYDDTDFINLSVSLARVVLDARQQGNRLVLANTEGKPFLQITPPSPEQMKNKRFGIVDNTQFRSGLN